MATEVPQENLDAINTLSLSGIEVKEDAVYAYPPQISNQAYTAASIAPYVEIPTAKLERVLKGENRYVILRRKLDPEISRGIEALMSEDREDKFLGLGMKEEYFRYYPEGSLAANVIGYVNRANIGQYGIESSFNTKLQGVSGKFQTKRDLVFRNCNLKFIWRLEVKIWNFCL